MKVLEFIENVLVRFMLSNKRTMYKLLVQNLLKVVSSSKSADFSEPEIYFSAALIKVPTVFRRSFAVAEEVLQSF